MKPILMNTEMVQAILEGKKTVTRRIMKPQPVKDGIFWSVYGAGWSDAVHSITPIPGHSLYNHAPYHPGDILYVRETWAWLTCGRGCNWPEHYECNMSPSQKGGCFAHKATHETGEDIKWRPSIHMPKEAARLFLRVKSVRVERLQLVSEEQAKQEGTVKAYPYDDPETDKTVFMQDENGTYVGGFSALWDSTIKPSDLPKYGWDANPWVWVIEFERCEKPEEG